MRTVPASEAKQAFASVLDTAMHEPVLIQRQKRDVAVVLSMAEYERLTRLNVAEFQRFCDQIGERATREGLDDAALAELLDETSGD
ncbi:type II toxin-antitoxin system Phd/YefM family antitoxin [Comamonas badia]|uniref:type II toxin-antitoxin system Phd/YefM family antitoxin n=1 Tax=Comamonas badia TaxID=265291 RepID=UPI00040845DD|nr:type II toxin-antitoxin system Phd/YefM family antitoxin [Comamonas badia]